MRWLKSDKWKAGIALAGMLLLLVLMVWVPVSAAGAYEGTSGLLIPVTAQATPTVNVTATTTALNEEKLRQEIQQLKNQNGNQNNWLVNNSTALIAAVATVIVALFGILQWAITVRQAQDKELRDQEDQRQKEIAAQDKELRAQAEERLKTAVAALGNEKEGTQVGGAILLRSFLHEEDKKNYERYYTQIFDLAVAYLRPPRTPRPSEDLDTPLLPLRKALITVFKEAFPLARSQNKGSPQSLDASNIDLDGAFLRKADLEQVWMPWAFLRGTDLNEAKLTGAQLWYAKLTGAQLCGAVLTQADLGADLSEADLSNANLTEAKLWANLTKAKLCGANLTKAKLCAPSGWRANLKGADLSKADLSGTNLEEAQSLEDTNLRGVKGLTKEQLKACKAKGAIIDEDTTTSASRPAVVPSPASQSNDAQVPSATHAQGNNPAPDTGESSTTLSKSDPEL